MTDSRRFAVIHPARALHIALCICVAVLLCVAGGCAPRYPGPAAEKSVYGGGTVPGCPGGAGTTGGAPEGTGHAVRDAAGTGTGAVSGVWLFRHKVRLDIPARNVSLPFDGLMRLEADVPRVRVTALGGFGLRLFAMEVGPDSLRVLYLHPSVKNVPRVTEYAAESIRRIWFDCLAQMPQTASASAPAPNGAAAGVPDIAPDIGYACPSEPGAGNSWRLTAGGSENVGENTAGNSSGGRGPWPETIHFTDDAAGYALTVRLAHAQQETTP